MDYTLDDISSSIALEAVTDENVSLAIADDVSDILLLSDVVEPIVGDIRENFKTASFIFEDLTDELAFTDILQMAIPEEECLQESIRSLCKTFNKVNLAVYNINHQCLLHSFETLVDVNQIEM